MTNLNGLSLEDSRASLEYHIGFTGTRYGMDAAQTKKIRTVMKSVIERLNKNKYETFFFHHGNCVGADEEAAFHAKNLSMHIVCHPPVKVDLESKSTADINEIVHPRKSHLARNRDIVDSSHVMLAAPRSEERVGGTWYTIEFAVKQKKPVLVVMPNGKTILFSRHGDRFS